MVLTPLSASFQSLPPLPTSKMGPSGADSCTGALCTFWDPVGLPNELSCEAGSFFCCCLNPHQVFSIRGLRLYFPAWSPGLRGLLRSPPFLRVYLCMNAGPWGLPATTSLGPPASVRLASNPLHPAACLCPSYRFGYMFLLYLLGCQTSIQFDILSVLVVFCF